MDVYQEIAQALVLEDGCLGNVTRRKLQGDVSDDFASDFTHIVMTAETLLLHAVRLGPEMWDLIRYCGLGDACRLKQPYYVTRPGRGNRTPAVGPPSLGPTRTV